MDDVHAQQMTGMLAALTAEVKIQNELTIALLSLNTAQVVQIQMDTSHEKVQGVCNQALILASILAKKSGIEIKEPEDVDPSNG